MWENMIEISMELDFKVGDKVRLDFDALARFEGTTPIRKMKPSEKLGRVVRVEPPYVIVDWGIWAWPHRLHHSVLIKVRS
jgi:hypothetical protein